jgi:Transposase DDE domain
MPYYYRAAMQALGLPETITIRCVLIDLPTGEEEVLFTSLLDTEEYPSEEFGDLYCLRWGEETYFDRVKNVMNIELFSGLSEESIQQDSWAMLLVSNMETVFSADAETILDAKPAENLYSQQVNHAVAFSILRREVMELVLSPKHSTDELLAQLTILFLQTPVPRRPNRSFPRTTPTQQVRFYKYVRKPAS